MKKYFILFVIIVLSFLNYGFSENRNAKVNISLVDSSIVTGHVYLNNNSAFPIEGVQLVFTLSDSTKLYAYTDSLGYYTLNIPYHYVGILVPIKNGYTFNPASFTTPGTGSHNVTANFSATAVHIISGKVLNGANPMSGVKMILLGLMGSNSDSTITGADGTYSFTVPPGGNYTLSAYKINYSFSPFTLVFSNLPPGGSVNDFHATLNTYTISGIITYNGNPFSGVTVSCPGANTTTQVTTDSAGMYSFTINAGGNYTVTPIKTNYTFTPANDTFKNVSNNQTRNFTAFSITFTISGYVPAGVTVSCPNANPPTQITADSTGFCSFIVNAGGNYTVSPTSPHYTFSPTSQTFNNVTGNQIFSFGAMVKTVTISGTITCGGIPLSGVLMSSPKAASALTDANGTYFMVANSGDNVIITPSKQNYSFIPNSKTFNNITGNQTQNFTATRDTFTISGNITSGGTPLSGVTVSCPNANSDTSIITNSTGIYSFIVNGGGNYTVTPTKANYAFSPTGQSFTNVTSNQIQNFTGTQNAFTISGIITSDGNPLSGVAVTCPNASSSTSVTTDAAGTYSFIVNLGGNYTVTPIKANFTFSPASQTFNNVTSNQAQNFTATQNTFTISGIITSGGTPLNGVTVSCPGANTTTLVTTDSNGTYSFIVNRGGNYTVTPMKTNYTFTPESKTFNNVTANQMQNFTAVLNTFTISGIITSGGTPLSGVNVSCPGANSATSVTTGVNGTYTFTVNVGGNYTITPTKTNYTFIPVSQIFSNVISNQTLNFNAILNTFAISGTIKSGGTPLSGVNVSCPGANSTTPVITDTNGAYTFTVNAGGNYTVTPTKTNYTFNPSSQTFNNLTANQTQNFSAVLNTFTISGIITSGGNPLSGVNVSCTGANSTTPVTTDANGAYTFTVNAGGNYTITPSKTNYTFTPVSQTFNNVTSNQTLNFTATLNAFSISGIITSGGTPLSGVTVTCQNANNSTSVTTNSDGTYVFTFNTAGNYIVTPTKTYYTFNPTSYTFNNVTSNHTQDFTASINQYTISGIIKDGDKRLANVTVTLSGGMNSTMKTNGTGEYSFTVNAGEDYSVIPSLDNYKFYPQIKNFYNINSNQIQDFNTVPSDSLTLSGKIIGASSVTVNLSGSSAQTIMDIQGQYWFYVKPGGTYTVTPSKSDYIFTPESKTYENLTTSQTQDFTATRSAYVVSGYVLLNKVGISNVKVTVTNNQKTESVFTDEKGFYSFHLPSGGTYLITASSQNYYIPPTVIRIDNLQSDFEYNFIVKNTISGTILFKGIGLSGVRIALSGSSTDTVITGVDGRYSFLVNDSGNFVVTPTLANYNFDPENKSFSNVTGNQIQNFSASLKTCLISGRIIYQGNGLSGVSVVLIGDKDSTLITDSSGNYSFIAEATKSYIVTPSKSNFTFNPINKLFSNITTDKTQNFEASMNVFTIGGKVTLNGTGLANVLITLSGGSSGTQLTDSTGIYLFSVVGGGNYTITPSRSKYSFTPSPKTISNISSNITQDFSAKLDSVIISGSILNGNNPVPNVTVFLLGSISKIYISVDGNYSFTVAANGNYTIKPRKEKYKFTPDSSNFSNISASIRSDFQGKLDTIILNGKLVDDQTLPQPIINAKISLIQSDNNEERTIYTNSTGNFSFTLPMAKKYSISIIKSGYLFSNAIKEITPISDTTINLVGTRITLLSKWPISSRKYNANDTCQISWSNPGITNGTIKIQYSDNRDLNFTVANGVRINDGKYTWTIPDTLESTTSASFILTLENDTSIKAASEIFSITCPKTITLEFPKTSGEQLIFGNKAAISWKYTGRIKSLFLKIKKSGGGWDYSKEIPNVGPGPNLGSYDWSVDIIPPLNEPTVNYYMKLVASDLSVSDSGSGIPFKIKNLGVLTCNSPSNDTINPVSVKPIFEWSYIPPVKQDAKNLNWRLDISTDTTFKSIFWNGNLNLKNTNLQGTFSITGVPELSCNTKYYWRVRGDYRGFSNNGSIDATQYFIFKTEARPPDVPILTKPVDGLIFDEGDSITTKFTWTRPLRANNYQIQVTEDTADQNQKLMDVQVNGMSTSISRHFTFRNGRILFWRVRASNDYGDGAWSRYNVFFMKSRFQTFGNINVSSDNWSNQTDGSLRGNNPIIKSSTGEHQVYLKNGYVLTNADKTQIIKAFGEANLFIPTRSKYIPLFSGVVGLTPTIITPDSTSVKTDSLLFGRLPRQNLVFQKIDLTAGQVYFTYNRLNMDLPGILLTDAENSVGDNVHFHPVGAMILNDEGVISGTAQDFTIEVGTILLKFAGVSIRGSAFDTVSFTSTNYKVNYMKLIGDAIDISESGGITISSGKNIQFDNDVVSCPEFNINIPNKVDFSFGFQAPKMSFRYVDDPRMHSWVMDIGASVTLPISFSRESTPSGGTTTTASFGGGCSIGAGLGLISTPPYFQNFNFRASGCWELMVFPSVMWTGMSGYVDLMSENSKITGFNLGGTVDLDIKPPTLPETVISGTLGIDFRSSGYLQLSGEASAFGKWPMGKSAIWFDWSDNSKVLVGASFDAKWAEGCVNGHLEGGIELSRNLLTRPNLFFEGLVNLKIPEGIINVAGLFGLPPNDINIAEIGAQIGQFKHGNDNIGYGFQAYTSIFDIDIAAYIPLETGGNLTFSTNLNELIKFQRKLAIRRKGNVSGIKNLASYHYGINADTIVVTVDDVGSGKLLFGIKSFQKNLPELTVINPENKIYQSLSMLQTYPQLKSDTGYAFPVKSVKGNWKVVISNITQGADYKLVVAGGSIAPQIKIDNIQKIDNTKYKITYSGSASNIKLFFNYTSSDAEVGNSINQDAITEVNKSGELIWDISNVKDGEYKIYSRVSDGIHNFTKNFYADKIIVKNAIRPNAPKNLKTYRIPNNQVKLQWESDQNILTHTLFVGSVSKQYTDTVIAIKQIEYILTPRDGTAQYYAVLKGKDVNGNESDYSNEIGFTLNSAQSDSLPPNAPNRPQISVILKSGSTDTITERINLSWAPVSNSSGYKIYLAPKSNNKFANIDIGNVTNYSIYNITRGETYLIKLQAYSSARMMSQLSEEAEVNFFSMQDMENDGMPDDWETKYFGSITITNNPTDDPDGDGLSNSQEFDLKTNPNNHDTDNDGVWDDVDVHPLMSQDNNDNGLGDDWEVYYRISDPDTDPDNDGLTNLQEFKYGTDPNNQDSDGGGLTDGEEIKRGLSPLDAKDDKWTPGFVQIEKFDGKFTRDNITRGDTIVLVWRTKKEQDLSGFNIVRKSSAENYWVKLNDAPILGLTDNILPHQYSYKDGKIQSGITYSYYLEGVSKWGNRDSLGIYLSSAFTAVEKVIDAKSEKYALEQNYPNPFNPSTKINFSIPIEGYTTLRIFDYLGRGVQILVDQTLKSGVYSVIWSPTNLPSGIYYYELRCGKYSEIKKMLFMK